GQRTEGVRGMLEQLPPVPPGYTKPADSAYKEAGWPKMDEKLGKDFGLLDENNKPVAPVFAFKPQGYFPSKPETVGRVTVVYLFHAEILASFDKVVQAMDQLQVSMSRDVAVIGVLVPAGKLDSQRMNQPGQTAEPPEKYISRVKDIISTH